MKPIALLVAGMAFVSGCETTGAKIRREYPLPHATGGAERTPPAQAEVPLKARPIQAETPAAEHKMSLEEARVASLQLKPGILDGAVLLLLGEPTETSVEPLGSLTPHPWQGLIWTYKWGAGYSTRSLRVIFEKVEDQWLVNSWSWR